MFFEMVINKYISTELRHTCVNTYGRSDWAKLIKAVAGGHSSASDDILFRFVFLFFLFGFFSFFSQKHQPVLFKRQSKKMATYSIW